MPSSTRPRWGLTARSRGKSIWERKEPSMARSWELGSTHSPCCRLWVESASPPTRKPPRTEALQTRAFRGRRMLSREN